LKRGEKVIFGIAVGLAIVAVLQVGIRSNDAEKPRQPRDYIEWTEAAHAGYALYKSKGCNSCHRVLRMGEIGVAPVLDGEGTRRSMAWLQGYFENPGSMVPGSAHDGSLGPDFRVLDASERELLAAFMVSLKSNPGSSNHPVPPAGALQE
jgi:cbb3-type cytochrome oxidase cytochrome c subunit